MNHLKPMTEAIGLQEMPDKSREALVGMAEKLETQIDAKITIAANKHHASRSQLIREMVTEINTTISQMGAHLSEFGVTDSDYPRLLKQLETVFYSTHAEALERFAADQGIDPEDIKPPKLN